MRKATLSVGRGFEIGTEPVPQPGPGEARVQVRACGVCQTEVHAIDGSLSRPDIPGMMGHEFSGEVVALGADGFAVQPRRWVVERTCGWLGRCRRLSKDYAAYPVSPLRCAGGQWS